MSGAGEQVGMDGGPQVRAAAEGAAENQHVVKFLKNMADACRRPATESDFIAMERVRRTSAHDPLWFRSVIRLHLPESAWVLLQLIIAHDGSLAEALSRAIVARAEEIGLPGLVCLQSSPKGKKK